MTYYLAYLAGASLVGGITRLMLERDRHVDSFDAALLAALLGLVWPLTAAIAVSGLLVHLTYRALSGLLEAVEKAAKGSGS